MINKSTDIFTMSFVVSGADFDSTGNLIDKNFTGMIEHHNGDLIKYVNGNRHCENGPAIIGKDGRKIWCLNGKYHREMGPAVIYPNNALSLRQLLVPAQADVYYGSTTYYYLDDEQYNKVDYWKKMWNLYKKTDNAMIIMAHMLGANIIGQR